MINSWLRIGREKEQSGLCERVQLNLLFSLKILRPARKILDRMDDNLAQKVYVHLENLKEDPFRPRPGMDLIN